MYSVLTYVFNGYDTLCKVEPDENIEYICVTDNPNIENNGWQIIVDKELLEMNPLMASFYVRYHPFKYCSSDICLRMDGSVKILKSPFSILEEFDSLNKDILVMNCGREATIEKEYRHWLFQSNTIEAQKQFCKENNIDIKKEGVLQSPISITRNNEICNKCDALCWELLNKFSSKGKVRPSQVLMTIAIYLTKGISKVFVDERFILSNYFQWYNHNSSAKRYTLRNKVIHKFFDEDIEIYKFKDVHYIDDELWGAAFERESLRSLFHIKK